MSQVQNLAKYGSSKFYNRLSKSWLHYNGLEMHSTHNEEKFVVVEKFLRRIKNKSYKYMTSISKKLFANKVDYIVDKFNNTYHSTIKVKAVDVKSSTYTDFNKKNNKEDPKFNAGDNARISK